MPETGKLSMNDPLVEKGILRVDHTLLPLPIFVSRARRFRLTDDGDEYNEDGEGDDEDEDNDGSAS